MQSYRGKPRQAPARLHPRKPVDPVVHADHFARLLQLRQEPFGHRSREPQGPADDTGPAGCREQDTNLAHRHQALAQRHRRVVAGRGQHATLRLAQPALADQQRHHPRQHWRALTQLRRHVAHQHRPVHQRHQPRRQFGSLQVPLRSHVRQRDAADEPGRREHPVTRPRQPAALHQLRQLVAHRLTHTLRLRDDAAQASRLAHIPHQGIQLPSHLHVRLDLRHTIHGFTLPRCRRQPSSDAARVGWRDANGVCPDAKNRARWRGTNPVRRSHPNRRSLPHGRRCAAGPGRVYHRDGGRRRSGSPVRRSAGSWPVCSF